MPIPSSSTSISSRPSDSIRLRSVTVPPPMRGSNPCLIEFSISGCSNMLGTITASVSSAISFTTRSFSPKRTTSMSR